MNILVMTGAGVLLLLGIAHAVATAQSSPNGGPLTPTNRDVRAAMEIPGGLGLAPYLKTPLWRAWIGFNYSHSLGVAAISLAIGVPALVDFEAAFGNLGWLLLALAVPPLYLLLSMRYWFRGPTVGITTGIALITAGILGEWII